MEKQITYTKDNRETLSGVLTKGDSERCVLMCHGFMGDKDENTLFSSLAQRLGKEDISSFRFDFSGCGENKKIPLSLKTMQEDIEVTKDFLDTIGFEKIYGLSHSLGSVPLIRQNIDSEHTFLLSPYYKPDERRIQLLEEEVGDEDQIDMKNRFGQEHIISHTLLDEMRTVDLIDKIEKEKTTIFLSEKDDIMPENYYEEIINLEKEFSNIISIKTNHFYTNNKKELYDTIVSIIED